MSRANGFAVEVCSFPWFSLFWRCFPSVLVQGDAAAIRGALLAVRTLPGRHAPQSQCCTIEIKVSVPLNPAFIREPVGVGLSIRSARSFVLQQHRASRRRQRQSDLHPSKYSTWTPAFFYVFSWTHFGTMPTLRSSTGVYTIDTPPSLSHM